MTKKKTKGTDQYDTAAYENPNRFVEKRNLQPHPLIKISCNVTRAGQNYAKLTRLPITYKQIYNKIGKNVKVRRSNECWEISFSYRRKQEANLGKIFLTQFDFMTERLPWK